MQQLIKGVLRVRAGLAPDDRARRALDRLAAAAHGLAVALHLELLEVRRQAREVVVVRQHRVRRRLEEIPVPDPDEREQHRQALGVATLLEVLVERVRAREHRGEVLPAHRERDREPDGRPDRVAAANPVPHREPPMRRDPELVHRFVVRRHRDALRRDRRLAAVLEQPLARGARVRERLERREGLRADHEQRRLGIAAFEHVLERDAVDVRDEVHA